MTDATYGTTSGSTLTAFFDSRHDAEKAVERLRDIGVDDASVHLVGGENTSGTSDNLDSGNKGFFESLRDFFIPDEDRYTYAEGLSRGGFLVTVSNLPSGQYDDALDILDDEGSVDVDARSDSWREEGWQGYSSSDHSTGTTMDSDILGATLGTSGGAAALGASLPNSTERQSGFSDDLGTGTVSSGYNATPTSDDLTSSQENLASSEYDRNRTSFGTTSEDESIPVIQESLRVGKRDVNLGRVRVRSYVVEEPVNEQVTLRNERVQVDRHPVDRALSDLDNAFTERTIEADEYGEEAVVSKEARVTEEISLHKTAEERNQTISDTVRRTEVEIEDERTDRGSGTLDR